MVSPHSLPEKKEDDSKSLQTLLNGKDKDLNLPNSLALVSSALSDNFP